MLCCVARANVIAPRLLNKKKMEYLCAAYDAERFEQSMDHIRTAVWYIIA